MIEDLPRWVGDRLKRELKTLSQENYPANLFCPLGMRNTPDLCVLFSVPLCLRG